MKKRIIASILAVVMTLLALCSCGATEFDFAEDSSDYTTVNLEEFKKALAAIQIEDGDFTMDEATRQSKVIYNILGTLTSNILKATADDEKLISGTLSPNDILYFCYYVTYTDADGKTSVFYGDQMKPSTITASATKANHVVELAVVKNNDDAKFGQALYDALVEKYGADENGKLNSIVLSNDAEGEEKIDLFYDIYSGDEKAVKAGDKIVISYTREKVLSDDATDDEKAANKPEKLLYNVNNPLVLDAEAAVAGSEEAALINLILGTNLAEGHTMSANVGETVTENVTNEDGSTTAKKEFTLNVDGVDYKYSGVKIEWKIDKIAEPLVSFDYELTAELSKENNALHAADTHGSTTDVVKVAKGEKVTYHIYPVNYIAIPDITATSIIKEIFGSKVTTDSSEILGSEEYKNGDNTVKSLVETLAKIWSADKDLIKNLKNEAGDKTVEALSTALSDANAALKAADKKAENYADLEDAVEAAQKAYDDAIEYNVDDQIKKIVAATKGEDTLEAALVKEYKETIYNDLKTAYDDEIVNNVGKAVWELVDKYVTVNSYPDEMVEEFYDHLYEEYEYKFYKESYSTSSTSTSSSKESNYAHYKGDFEAYLVEATKATNGDYAAAITAKAKEYLKPILQVYALAKAIEDDATVDISAVLLNYANLDYEQGKYTVQSHEGHNHGEDEADDEQKSLDKSLQYIKDSATNKHFLVDEDAIKAYKNFLGKAEYKARVDYYGEVNIHAGLQLGKLMDYLLSVDVSYDDDGEMNYKYKTVGEGEDAVTVISFRTLSYSIKVEDDSTEGGTNE